MRRAISFVALTAICAALTALPSPATAQIGGPIGAPVVFRPKPGTTLHIEGRGSFHGSIEIRRDGSGVTIINELDLESYVSGVREVPGLWPMEALKAQSVAARTYALWEKERGYWQRFGFDVCGTVSCQVYQGADAQLGERGRRWTEGVRSTAGEVLLHEGEPALTRYHSSSGGTTLANEVVYPSSGPRPYLRSVDDEFDRVSPLHRWEVNFPRADLERILGHAVNLGGTIVDIRVNGREMVIRTQGGELEMSTVRFRREVSESAPVVLPSRYPSARSDGQRLPATIPSSRFTVRKTADGFLVQGKGYGHGVGMSQWGAMGRAEEGHRYDEILSAYYTGLRPSPLGSNPVMRVAVVQGVSDVRVTGDGAFGVFTNGNALSASTVGAWTVRASGERSVQLSPPEGYSLPLVLTGVSAPREQHVDPPEEGGLLHIDVVLPKAAQITGVLRREGADIAQAKTVVEAGERRLSIPLTGEGFPRRAVYELSVEAFDGTNTVDQTLEVVLTRPPSNLWLRVLAGVVLALILFVVWRRRRRILAKRAKRAGGA